MLKITLNVLIDRVGFDQGVKVGQSDGPFRLIKFTVSGGRGQRLLVCT